LSRGARYVSGSEDNTCSVPDGSYHSVDSFPSGNSVPCTLGKPTTLV